MRRRKSWLIAFFVLVAVGIAVKVSINGGRPIRVRMTRPSRGPVPEIVTSNSVGSVEPLKTAVVAAEIAGKIQRILVRQGEVRDGQAIVELDSRDLEAEREVTRRDIETARSRIEQAALRKKKVWEDLERLKGVDVPKGDVQRTERDLEIAKKDEDISQLSLKTLEAQLDVLELKLKKTQVAAPFPGTVVKLHSEEGESVTPGKSLFTIHSADPLLVRAPIDEVDMGRLALGQLVRLTFDGYEGQAFEGTLYEMMPAASTDQKNNRTVDVKVRPAKLPPNILAGMSANVHVIVHVRDGVLNIPTHLIHEDRLRNEKYVFVSEDGAARRRNVRLGISNWETTEIMEGLGPQDQVIVPLQFTDEPPVTEGARVALFHDGK